MWQLPNKMENALAAVRGFLNRGARRSPSDRGAGSRECEWRGLEPLEPRVLLTADLILSELTFDPGVYDPGDSFAGSVTESNIGDTDVPADPPFFIRIFLSADTVLDASDIELIEIVEDEGLDADEEFEFVGNPTIPASTPPGDYFVLGVIDVTDVIDESDETNNTIVSAGQDITVAAVPEITVLGNGHSIPDGDTTPQAADLTDFGSVDAGQSEPTSTFVVRNDGNVLLALNNLNVPNGFTLTEPLVSSLDPGQSDTFTIQLDTATPGTKSGQLSFTTNDGDENPFNFSITGVVQSQSHAIDNVQFSPSSPAVLSVDENVDVVFDYVTDAPDGVRIFARPFTDGSINPGSAAHASPVHPTGNGRVTGFFTKGGICFAQPPPICWGHERW